MITSDKDRPSQLPLDNSSIQFNASLSSQNMVAHHNRTNLSIDTKSSSRSFGSSAHLSYSSANLADYTLGTGITATTHTGGPKVVFTPAKQDEPSPSSASSRNSMHFSPVDHNQRNDNSELMSPITPADDDGVGNSSPTYKKIFNESGLQNVKGSHFSLSSESPRSSTDGDFINPARRANSHAEPNISTGKIVVEEQYTPDRLVKLSNPEHQLYSQIDSELDLLPPQDIDNAITLLFRETLNRSLETNIEELDYRIHRTAYEKFKKQPSISAQNQASINQTTPLDIRKIVPNISEEDYLPGATIKIAHGKYKRYRELDAVLDRLPQNEADKAITHVFGKNSENAAKTNPRELNYRLHRAAYENFIKAPPSNHKLNITGAIRQVSENDYIPETFIRTPAGKFQYFHQIDDELDTVHPDRVDQAISQIFDKNYNHIEDMSPLELSYRIHRAAYEKFAQKFKPNSWI